MKGRIFGLRLVLVKSLGNLSIMIKINLISEPTPRALDAINSLLPQLSKSAKLLNAEEFAVLISTSSSLLFFAEEEDCVLGMLSLVIFRIPTGLRAWVEDVVVDEKARGKGVGKALSEHALKEAFRLGATTIDLTSRPSRIAANQLYQRVGFAKRDTNVYRFSHSS